MCILSAFLLLLSSLQLATWLDAVILVFSLENEASFQEVYSIYHQLAAHRPVSEIPFIVVGTQGKTLTHNMFFYSNVCRAELTFVICFLDKISSTNPRVIDDTRARQLCSDVRRCTYYETCATYGLNVNRVFTDGVCKDNSIEGVLQNVHINLFLCPSFERMLRLVVQQLLRRSWQPRSKLLFWLPVNLSQTLPVTLEAPPQCRVSFQDR